MTADEVVELLSRSERRQWRLIGKARGGEVGAYLVQSPDGPRVLKWSERPLSVAEHEQTFRLLDTLHTIGYPLPRYDPPRPFVGGVALVQQQVRIGAVSDQVTHTLLDDVLAVNEMQSGLAAGETSPWPQFLRQTLLVGADGWCIHQSLRKHSKRASDLLRRIEAVGASFDDGAIETTDVMHIDFHHRNMFQKDDHLVAVIDWEGAIPGDRMLDLVTFAVNLPAARTDPGVQQRLWGVIEQRCNPQALSAYVAHMALRQVDWTIRFHPSEADLWLEHAESLLTRYAAPS